VTQCLATARSATRSPAVGRGAPPRLAHLRRAKLAGRWRVEGERLGGKPQARDEVAVGGEGDRGPRLDGNDEDGSEIGLATVEGRNKKIRT